MIAPMKKIEVFAMRDKRKQVMEALQKMGCVQITNTSEDELLKVSVKEKMSGFERYMANASQALDILEEIAPTKKEMFSQKQEIDISNYSMPKENVEKISKTVFEIISKNKKINDISVDIAQRQTQILNFEGWTKLDVAMNFNSLKSTEVALYTINSNISPERIDEILADARGVYYEIISAKNDLSCVWFLFLKEESAYVHKLLREAGFVPPQVSLSHRTPEAKIEHLKIRIKELTKEAETLKKELAELSKNREDIKLLYDYMKVRHEKYENLELLKETKKTFILTGFLPRDNAPLVLEKLEEIDLVYARILDVAEDEEAPVLFKNNGFASPVEEITSTYSMPSKDDIDPNGIMAFFYYLFFGMMFSDAGYGILTMIGTGYLAFVKKYNPKFMKMFFFCGISTTFWGLMYGSFFGDLVYRFSITFLGKEITLSPIWVDPAKEPLMLLIFSILLGLIQIFVGLSINFYMNWRKGEKAAAIFDTGSWMAVILGIIFLAVGLSIGISVLTTIGAALAILGAITEVLMKGRDKKNILLRLFSGILGLYDVTSYVSDALSYSRLMALGLATGVIAQVVNIMGTLAGKSVLGVIMFTVVFILGHLLNFAINMLGAYVHTNRLQYVEFYSKFYEGGGYAFKPMGMHTKYYDFK